MIDEITMKNGYVLMRPIKRNNDFGNIVISDIEKQETSEFENAHTGQTICVHKTKLTSASIDGEEMVITHESSILYSRVGDKISMSKGFVLCEFSPRMKDVFETDDATKTKVINSNSKKFKVGENIIYTNYMGLVVTVDVGGLDTKKYRVFNEKEIIGTINEK